MKRILKRLSLLLLLVIAFFNHISAQNLSIDFIEFVGRNVVVHYTLDDGGNSNRQFLVQLYSSQDNYTTPITRVTGDVGTEVTAGFDRKIVWDITKELGNYSGTLALELRGRVYVPFVKLAIKEGQVYKRGKNYPLNWTSGNLSGMVNIELFNESGERIWGENNVPNIGKFDWFLPGSVKKGNNYKLKFTNTKDRNDAVYSQPIVIKPKVPFLIKAGTFLLASAGVGYILMMGNEADNAKPYADPPTPDSTN